MTFSPDFVLSISVLLLQQKGRREINKIATFDGKLPSYNRLWFLPRIECSPSLCWIFQIYSVFDGTHYQSQANFTQGFWQSDSWLQYTSQLVLGSSQVLSTTYLEVKESCFWDLKGDTTNGNAVDTVGVAWWAFLHFFSECFYSILSVGNLFPHLYLVLGLIFF